MDRRSGVVDDRLTGVVVSGDCREVVLSIIGVGKR